MNLKTRITLLKEHPGFRKYFANTSWLVGERILRMGVSLFVGIYVARYLGPERYGLLSYANSFVGIFLAFAGVVILIFEPTIFSDLGGVYYALLAAFSISFSLLFMKKLKNIKVFDLQVWIAWTSFIFLAFISLLVEDNQILIIQSASINAWIAVIFTAIVATGIGHAGFYYLLTKYDVSRITPLTLLAPVLAITNALIITYFSIFDGFDETITLKILLGGSLTLIGVAIVMIREKENEIVSTV